MTTAHRLLELLALLGARSQWTCSELADRLEVTERTVRRDITRLRDLDYPVLAAPGLHGGYRLGAGGRLPPLVLNDEEAVAISVGLAAMAGAGTSGLELPAVTALTKLDRVLPARLRERGAAVRAVTLGLGATSVPTVDTDALVAVALASQRPERIRFDYRDAADRESHRLVEPFRLVFTARRWYLVARDIDRDAWRTFRVDRMERIRATGVPFVRGEVPDAARQVAEGLAVRAYDTVATIRFLAGRDEVELAVPPTVGIIASVDDEGVIVRIGGDADWIARFLAGHELRYVVIEPETVRKELRAIGRRLQREHGRRPAPPTP